MIKLNGTSAAKVTDQSLKLLNKLDRHVIKNNTVIFKNINDNTFIQKSIFYGHNFIFSGMNHNWQYFNYNKYNFPNAKNMIFFESGVESSVVKTEHENWNPNIYFPDSTTGSGVFLNNKTSSDNRFHPLDPKDMKILIENLIIDDLDFDTISKL